MSNDNTLFMVKDFLTASTPEELVMEQLENNFAKGFRFNYNIVHDGKSWFAWYDIALTPRDIFNESSDKK